VAERVAEGVHRLGSSLVNLYLVEEDGRFTLVDGGLPGYYDQIPQVLESLGGDLGDLEAVVLTHAHADHVGVVNKVRETTGARVLVHEADEEMLRTGKIPDNEGSMLGLLRHPPVYRLLAHAIANGGAKPQKVDRAETFTADAGELDVPGRPRVVPTPGHSAGHVAFHLPDRGVVLVGDALCTRNPVTGADGPQLMPLAFTRSSAEARASLDAIAATAAPVVLPGHGEPWTDGAATAAERARSAKAS
jgi:glyoxylase-like metal-dependent hydrolase (beta-lactamase superfamily II)